MTKIRSTKKSAIEDLRAELAARRALVEACQKKHDEAVERARKDLERARAGVDQYVAMIAEALGLPNPTAREARRIETLRLKKRARDLLQVGRSTSEIATELGISMEIAEEIVAKIRKRAARCEGGEEPEEEIPPDEPPGPPAARPLRLPPEAGQKGWKRERVRVLVLEGKTVDEIADSMDISADSVRTHIAGLRKDGLLPPSSRGRSPGSADPPREAPPDSSQDGGGGDSLEDLRAEIARQQGGQRGRQARLATTSVAIEGDEDEHEHVAVLDRMGDGVTVPDETGHQHRVYRFVVGGSAGHRHGLLAKEPPAEA